MPVTATLPRLIMKDFVLAGDLACVCVDSGIRAPLAANLYLGDSREYGEGFWFRGCVACGLDYRGVRAPLAVGFSVAAQSSWSRVVGLLINGRNGQQRQEQNSLEQAFGMHPCSVECQWEMSLALLVVHSPVPAEAVATAAERRLQVRKRHDAVFIIGEDNC